MRTLDGGLDEDMLMLSDEDLTTTPRVDVDEMYLQPFQLTNPATPNINQ